MNMDYSFLFNNSSSQGSVGDGLYSSLGDLYSIKSGTYKKLVSAYYKKTNGEGEVFNKFKDSVTSSGTTEASKAADRLKTSASSLKEAADAFETSGSKSLFNQVDITTKGEDGQETTTKGYDLGAIYDAAKKFIDSYNGFVTEAGKSESDAVKRQGSNMVTQTAVNKNLLAKAGITINKDNTLSIDENSFKKADISTIKTLFKGNSSFASQAAAKAGMVSSTASSEAELHKIYGSNGKTQDTNIGSTLDSFF